MTTVVRRSLAARCRCRSTVKQPAGHTASASASAGAVLREEPCKSCFHSCWALRSRAAVLRSGGVTAGSSDCPTRLSTDTQAQQSATGAPDSRAAACPQRTRRPPRGLHRRGHCHRCKHGAPLPTWRRPCFGRCNPGGNRWHHIHAAAAAGLGVLLRCCHCHWRAVWRGRSALGGGCQWQRRNRHRHKGPRAGDRARRRR